MKLAVIFPGIGYHCDKPLLYYARKLAAELGYEVLALDYAYEGGNIRGDKSKMKAAFEALYAQAEDALREVDFGKYDEVLFTSKSVGTIIASAYAYKHGVRCRQVLYTPLEYTFEYPHEKACAFIGTADAWSQVDKVVEMAKGSGVPIFVYDNLNHSLEGDDVMENVRVLERVMEETRRFMGE